LGLAGGGTLSNPIKELSAQVGYPLPPEFAMPGLTQDNIFKLPDPRYDGLVSVEHALFARRSVRSYKDDPLTVLQISQLLWSAQGVSSPSGYRTSPSAGALYPLEVYLVAGRISDLSAGIYKYIIHDHALRRTVVGDPRENLCRAALNQRSIANAPAVLLFSTVNERMTRVYGERGVRYIYMELGHAAQNVCLQAVALGLGTVVIGAFRDRDVKKIAALPEDEQPAYVIAVGR
jgi:SagB-type dehydrogenase family enzyme